MRSATSAKMVSVASHGVTLPTFGSQVTCSDDTSPFKESKQARFETQAASISTCRNALLQHFEDIFSNAKNLDVRVCPDHLLLRRPAEAVATPAYNADWTLKLFQSVQDARASWTEGKESTLDEGEESALHVSAS